MADYVMLVDCLKNHSGGGFNTYTESTKRLQDLEHVFMTFNETKFRFSDGGSNVIY